ncbi:MAG: hypothetical protein IPK82_06525 [Polyangiaceae bacterium]|nr:hypothetical protein [Polyangiaceae bacterium]
MARSFKQWVFAAAVGLVSLESVSAEGAPLLHPPGDPSFSPLLMDLANGYQRQQDVFCTIENGLSLDPIVQPDHVATVQNFFAQTASNDFEMVTGLHPHSVLAFFGEHGDEGNFAGIASVGVAARLLELRRMGAPESDIAPAREAAERAAYAWYLYGTIGGPGVVARGIRRVNPWDAADPPFPGEPVTVEPLKDQNGNPNPADKSGVWRAPVVAGFEDYVWLDDTSKDQVSGYALAVMWLWDALEGDPQVDPTLRQNLASGLVAFAKALMKVAPETGTDLCIRDADGRLTKHYDLNPRQLSPDGAPLPEDFGIQNGFNAALALGIIRAAYHVSGDPDIGKYYYEELVGKRDLPGKMATNSGAIFLGTSTNYSNVNMLAIAFATLGRIETDPTVRSKLEETLQNQFWAPGSSRDVEHAKQAWFDAVYGGYSAAPPSTLRVRVLENLGGFQPAPAFTRDRVNCDEAEIAAGVCTAVDGSQFQLEAGKGHNGIVVAKEILPMSIRPDSDFVWRSDPHEVNGKASTLLNPGGDYLAAYWLSRVVDIDDTSKNVSPLALDPLPYSQGGAGGAGGTGGSGAGGGGGTPNGGSGGAGQSGDTGCSCNVEGRVPDGDFQAALLFLAALAVARRRRQSPAI